MAISIQGDETYTILIKRLSQYYRQSQLKAATQVNSEMLKFYWTLGKDIIEMKAESKWGANFIRTLSIDLKKTLPGVKGLSETNIGYAKRFFLLYSQLNVFCPQDEGEINETVIHPQVGGNFHCNEIWHIPWGHHKYIIDKFYKCPQKAIFFVKKTLENGWSRNMLLNFMGTDLYERQGKAITNFNETLPAVHSDLAQEITKDPYNFDFLAMTEGYREKELKDALEINIRNFLLELGSGFAYVGREYRIVIGQTEKFIDMLFYNLNLRCYVVLEIKTGKFESEYIGQLGTYIAAVNHIIKTDMDNPTIGLLICKTKDNILAQYALETSNQPIGISEYELSKLYPANFKGSLPTIEEIEKELNNKSAE